jgi:hypothetical protein
MNAVRMSIIAAMSYGNWIAARWCAASSNNTARLRSGK